MLPLWLRLCVCVSVCLHALVSLHLDVFVSTCQCVCVFLCLYAHISMCPLACMSCMSVCPYVRLPTHMHWPSHCHWQVPFGRRSREMKVAAMRAASSSSSSCTKALLFHGWIPGAFLQFGFQQTPTGSRQPMVWKQSGDCSSPSPNPVQAAGSQQQLLWVAVLWVS